MNLVNLIDFIKQGLPPVIVFFDTETTGFPSKTKSWDDPTQARCVQLGVAVVDTKERIVRNTLDVIIQVPSVPAVVADIHGISTEISEQYGLSEHVALVAFADMIRDFPVCAHNTEFDVNIMSSLSARCEIDNPLLDGRILLDTMEDTKEICKVPLSEKQRAKNMSGYKTPKLIEAFCALVDEKGFENAHSAMADVNACIEVFWAVVDLVERGEI